MADTTYVAVCGPASCTPAQDAQAREIGHMLAAHGVVVVCGGYGGVMAAVAAGARSAGGLVVGLLSGSSRSDACPDLSVAIPTGLGEMRNALIVRAADAVIVVGGSWGTLSELALARRRGIPVVTLGGWHILDSSGDAVAGLTTAADPADAVRLALTGRGSQ